MSQKARGMYAGALCSSCLINLSTTEVLKAQMARGCDVVQGLQLIDHGLWDHPAMDPNSCGVVGIFAPIGPWPQSEHSSLLLCFLSFPFRSVSDVWAIVLMHRIGPNTEEHQRLGMLGTLERQNMRVSRHCSSRHAIDNPLIPPMV